MNNLMHLCQYGENSHIEYAWAINLKDALVQFFFQLVRCDNHNILERKLHLMLSFIKGREDNYREQFILLYKMIGQTRDIHNGKGEYHLANMMIFIWYEYYPELALFVFSQFVRPKNPYGSWKDVKYLCNYVLHKTTNSYHPIIEYACNLVCSQLQNDIQDYRNNSPFSLAAKWIPREKSKKFGWLFKKLASYFFPSFSKLKARIHFRKILSTLNHTLDTTQIKMCNGRWSSIIFNTLPARTMLIYNKAFQNRTKSGKTRFNDNDRYLCAGYFDYYLTQLNNKKDNIHGKRLDMYDLVKKALEAKTSSDKELVNALWEDNKKNNHIQGNILAIIDTSFSMEKENSRPLLAAIGLGIRVAECSCGPFYNRILTLSATPEWIELGSVKTFVEKVQLVFLSNWGLQSNLYLALKNILDIIIKHYISFIEVEKLVLAIFSDMQLYHPSNYKTIYENIQQLFSSIKTDRGKKYKAPHILFWNMRQTNGFPATSSHKNVTMLSGYNSNLLRIIHNGGKRNIKKYTPYTMIARLLSHKRYNILENKFFCK